MCSSYCSTSNYEHSAARPFSSIPLGACTELFAMLEVLDVRRSKSRSPLDLGGGSTSLEWLLGWNATKVGIRAFDDVRE